MNLPVWLSAFRALVIFPILLLHYLDIRLCGVSTAMMLLVAGGISDWLDGWLARRTDQVSNFGAFLDPVADKILVVGALMLLVSMHAQWYVTLPAVLMVVREIAVAGMREWAAYGGGYGSLGVRGLGKVKTIMQFTCISIFLQDFEHPLGFVIANALLWITLVVALVSGALYARSWVRHLQKDGLS